MTASPRGGRRVRIDPPPPGDRRPNYIADPDAILAVARAWADAGPVPSVHRAAQKELRRSFPLLARALDRLTGERPR